MKAQNGTKDLRRNLKETGDNEDLDVVKAPETAYKQESTDNIKNRRKSTTTTRTTISSTPA